MRNLIIDSLGRIIDVVVIIFIIAIVLSSFAMIRDAGLLMGLSVLVSGGIALSIFGGLMYLLLGIHGNTRKTAELLEKMQKNPE